FALRDQIGLEVAREAAQLLLDHLVAANEEVVAKNRRNRDEQAQRGHDQRFTDRTRDLVDRRLTGDADRDKRLQDTPHRSEQTDERCRRTDRGKEGDTALKPRIGVIELAGQRHGDPVVEADQRSAALAGANAAFRDQAEHRVLRQLVDAFVQRARGPEAALDIARLAEDAALLEILDEEDVRAADRHDSQKDENADRDRIALVDD